MIKHKPIENYMYILLM